MGSSSSKFRKALQKGEQVEAMNLYLKHPEIKRNINPNGSFGENHGHKTPLHYAALHAMKPFIREFMAEGANPNNRSNDGWTAIHCACITNRGGEYPVDKHRAECISYLVAWRNSDDSDGVDMDAKDKNGNTALHFAASSGLLQCVQLLVASGYPLYEENSEQQTACDCAMNNGYSEVAAFLESKMVFSSPSSGIPEEEPVFIEEPDEHQYRGLCAQDLQEAKDLLLVETADMLRVPLFTAEALLRNHEWSKEGLIEAWMTDSKAACEKAGVKVPDSHVTDDDLELERQKHPCLSTGTEICAICGGEIASSALPLSLSCGHEFCPSCWESYLNVKIKEGNAHNIQCPAFECSILVPLETIESLVSREMASRYLHFDIKAFVESNRDMKWCPVAGCGRAVRLPSAPPPGAVGEDTCSETVDCGSGHYFCWHCLHEAHEPCSCELWQKWLNKIATMMAQIPTTDNVSECPETELVANTLWLVTNSKPCPNCKSPIQKTEGCNHMKCTKCKHEFCWVCQEPWKKHSSATGGYFRCNRFEVVSKIESEAAKSVKEASAASSRVRDINYFLHYYSRFKNHENSYKLEEPLLESVKEKMNTLAVAAVESASSPNGARFIEDAMRELLKARRVLKASYGYGFFLEGNKEKKTIFEQMQTGVEESAETLSQMVARPYLRTPRAKIIQTTHLLQQRRQAFLLALARGVLPDDDEDDATSGANDFFTWQQMVQLAPSPTLPLQHPDPDEESDEGEDNFEEVHRAIEDSIRRRLMGLDMLHERRALGDMGGSLELAHPRRRDWNFQQSVRERLEGQQLDLSGKHITEEAEPESVQQQGPSSVMVSGSEEWDLMRAIHLSLLQSGPPAQGSRRSSSSSGSAASVAECPQQPQEIQHGFQTSSMQRAIEMSLHVDDSSQAAADDDLRRAIELSLQDVEPSSTTTAQGPPDR